MEHRNHEVTRLEGFSDAVFGFALTLLVVRLETPRSTAELSDLLRGAVPFAAMFAMVCYIWWEHNVFFRRYGLQDALTAFINSVLLFVVLFYVYPLKYLTMGLLGPAFGVSDLPRMSNGRFVLVVYSTGVVLIFGCLALLYQRAWTKRASLALTLPGEISLRFGRIKHVLSALIGIASIVLALLFPEGAMTGIAGLTYILMGPVHAWHGVRLGRALERASAESS